VFVQRTSKKHIKKLYGQNIEFLDVLISYIKYPLGFKGQVHGTVHRYNLIYFHLCRAYLKVFYNASSHT
jgi:hypothetical protein